MKSIKLTNSIKEQIILLIIKEAMQDQQELLTKQEHSFALACYNACYSKEQQEAMINFPNSHKAFNWRTKICVYIQGQQVHVILSKSMPLWAVMPDSKNKFDKQHPLMKQWTELCHTRSVFLSDRTKLRAEILAILGQCNTTKQLSVLWPECIPYLKCLSVFKKPTPVPMKSPDTLNKLLCSHLGTDSVFCNENGL
jgi:hypothetical protein